MHLLVKAMEHRCSGYFDKKSNLFEQCAAATVALVEQIDCSKPMSSVRTCYGGYGNELLALLNQPRVQDYLSNLNNQFTISAKNQTKFNLWDFTLKATNGDEQEALKWIAILFQDITDPNSLTKGDETTHLTFLKSNFRIHENFPSKSTINSLEKVINFIEDSPWVNLYPNGVTSKDKKLYHFYTPAFLAKNLVVQ